MNPILQAEHAQYGSAEQLLAACRAFKDFFAWATNVPDSHVSDIPKLVLRGLGKINVQHMSQSPVTFHEFSSTGYNSQQEALQ